MRLKNPASKWILAGAVLAAAAAAIAARVVVVRRRQRFDFFQTFRINASSSDVYDFFSRLDVFPGFFSHISDVRKTGQDNEWRWSVGRNGQSVEWDTWVTESIPGKCVAWESAPGAAVKQCGVVHFSEVGDGTTQVDVRLSYMPLRRSTGEALSSAFGADRARAFSADLIRLKRHLERVFEDVPTPT